MRIDFTQVITAEDKAAAAAAAMQARLTGAIDQHVEATAQARGYNSAAHIAGYATSTVTDWQAEAQAFVAWRDAVWLAAFAILAEVQSGARDVPDEADLIGELPVIEWPE
jgi:stage V sporulation protein SpoVS